MKYLFFFFFMLVSCNLQAQFEPNTKGSVALFLGTAGGGLRVDLAFAEQNMQDPFTGATYRLYFDIGFKPISFAKDEIMFNNETFSSRSSLTTYGLGLGMDFKVNRVSLYPFFGFRYYHVRFLDQTLADAIGSTGLQRWETNQFGDRIAVGSLVENSYGDAVALDVGASVGLHLTPVVELGGLVALSPTSFDTDRTLFGRYWGEAPYVNPYYVQIRTLRVEGRIRFNF